MGSKTIIGLGLLALLLACAFCVMRHYPYPGMAGTTATLDARMTGGKVVLTGNLPSQGEKDRLIAQARTSFGAENFIDRLTVDGAAANAGWLGTALGVLPLANRTGANGGITLDARGVTLTGQAPSEEVRKDLVAKASAAAAGLTVTDRLTIGAAGAALPPFTARLLEGKVTLDGMAPDQEARAKILAAAVAAFGAGNFIDNLKIAPPGAGLSWGANWLQRILGWLPFLGRFGGKGEISFNGQSVTVNGEVATADIKSKLLGDLRGIFGADFTINDNLTVTESLLSEGEARAQANLKQLLAKGVEFASGSDKITPAGAAVLDEAARALAEAKEAHIEISGHTDNVGADKMNLLLSQRRAESVRKYLVGKAIAADRLTSRGYGPSQPIADNATDEGKARNRRIEFRVIPAKAKN